MSYHPIIESPLNDFIAASATAGSSLARAVVALFNLILAFGHFWFDKVVQFALTCVQLGLDLFRGVAGFVVANLFILVILGGGYYWWSTRPGGGINKRAIKLRK
ncbi:hypothetical protein F5148DRAFT_973764 [Russula earlei]|uniref:Uncharacterized protein n=1 Tax=Russula earlei TaxID=71964 RepID=A0ACC0UNE4_9AGAM|nr:hypothetical protein F5148DRAFT_973764 [Russula earlei]